MSIITLTTDFGLKDHFVGVIKANIYNKIKDAVIIDLSHDIDAFNHTEASYIIKASVNNFPDNTIHLIGVDNQASMFKKHVIVKWKQQYFVGTDNGIMSMVIPDNDSFEAFVIEKTDTNQTVMDFYTQIAQKITEGVSLSQIGNRVSELKNVKSIQPIINQQNNEIIISVIYIDGMGNLVFNITKDQFVEVVGNKKFSIITRPRPISKVYDNYGVALSMHNDNIQNIEGTKIAIFNEANHLEIGVFGANPKTSGSASTLGGLGYFDTLKIQLLD